MSATFGVKSCVTCPSYSQGSQVTDHISKNINTPMCSRYGHILSMPRSTDKHNAKIVEVKAASCPSHGEPQVRANLGQLNLQVAFPTLDADTYESDPSKKELCKSCAMCEHFMGDNEVEGKYGWWTGLCTAKGKLILGNRQTFEARGCEFRQFGHNRTAGHPMMLMPEFEDGFWTKAAFKDLLEKQAAKADPKVYETDKEVSPEDTAAGIRAWRKVVDTEGTHNFTFLPIFSREFFDAAEQAKIPNTGDDEHPESYLDHNGAVYKVSVAWMELDETPAMWGVAGTGKTELLRHLAWLMQLPFERISITGSTELDDLAGKGHPHGTRILTPSGWTWIECIEPGDQVIGSDGQPIKVLDVHHRGELPISRVTMTDHSSVLVDDAHLWSVTDYTGIKRTLSTHSMKRNGWTRANGNTKYRIPQVKPVEFDSNHLPFSPYLLGVMLGDGCFRTNGCATFASRDQYIVDRVTEQGEGIFTVVPNPGIGQYRLNGIKKHDNKFLHYLKRVGLWGCLSSEKFIPNEYLTASPAARLQLLRGLMDTDGGHQDGVARYTSNSPRLIEGVDWLIKSLGGYTTRSQDNRDECVTLSIRLPLETNPFSLPRKADTFKPAKKPVRSIRNIQSAGTAEVICLSVDAADQLYVTEDFIVTHNCLFENNETIFKYGRVPLAWAKPSVICLDEPNVGPPDVWQFIRPLTDNSKQLVLDQNKGERIPRHDSAFMGLCMNPAWDAINVGTQVISDADGSRLLHIFMELPPAEVEREIIRTRVSFDGWEISDDQLNTIMGIAADLRGLVETGSIPISWGIRPQIKVARASRWFDLIQAYRMGAADMLEPNAQEEMLNVVRAHVEDKKTGRRF